MLSSEPEIPGLLDVLVPQVVLKDELGGSNRLWMVIGPGGPQQGSRN